MTGEITVDDAHFVGTFTVDQVAAQNVDVDQLLSTTTEVEAKTLTFAATDAHAHFGVGGDYWLEDTDADGQIDADEINPEATGFAMNDAEVGLAVIKPTTTGGLFYSAKAQADDFDFVGSDLIDLSIGTMTMEINSGATASNGLGAVNLKSSFESTEGANDGAITLTTDSQAGTTVDLDSVAKSAEVTAHNATLSLSDYIHAVGDFSFGYALPSGVTLGTGLPANLGDITASSSLFNSLIDARDNHSLNISSDLSTISNVQMAMLQMGASNVNVFAGLNGPYKSDTDGDGDLTDETANENSTGVWIENVDLGFAFMTPTNPAIAAVLPTFYSVKATADQATFVGDDDLVELGTQDVVININDGSEWPGGIGPAVVDWQASFPATEGNSAGLQVSTDNQPVHIDFDGNQRIGATVKNAHLNLADYVHAVGNFSFEKGPTTRVNLGTGLPANIGQLTDETGLVADIRDAIEAATGIDTNSTLNISDDLSTISNLEVATTQIGASDVSVFVGLNGPYKKDANNDGVLDAPNEDAVGLWMEDVDFGFAQMEPTLPGLSELFPSFHAVKAEAAAVEFVGGGDIVDIGANDISITVNDGSNWPGGIGPAVVDWSSSYPAEVTDRDGDGKIDPAGFEVGTGGDPVYIDFDGNQRIGATVKNAHLNLADYVHAVGNFSFEKGPQTLVNLGTGLPANIGQLADGTGLVSSIRDAIEDATGIDTDSTLNISDDLSTIFNLDVASTQIGASDVSVFVGLNGPYKKDANNDGVLDAPNEDAVGLWMEDVDFGFAQMEPTLPGLSELFPSFHAVKADAAAVEFVGGGDIFELGAQDISITVNDGSNWPGGIGPAVVDWSSSFPAETADANADDGGDSDGDGKIDPAGFEVGTGGAPVYIDYDGNQRIGASLENAQLNIADFVHATGNFSFEKGPQTLVDLGTGLPGNIADLAAPLVTTIQDAITDAAGLEGHETLSISDDLATIYNLDVATTQFGASDVSVFVGMNGPYKVDSDNDGDLTDETPDKNAAGLWIEDVDFGFAQMEPTLPGLSEVFPSFHAIKAKANAAKLVGFDSVEMGTDAVTLTINDGSEWPGGFGPMVVDWG